MTDPVYTVYRLAAQSFHNDFMEHELTVVEMIDKHGSFLASFCDLKPNIIRGMEKSEAEAVLHYGILIAQTKLQIW